MGIDVSEEDLRRSIELTRLQENGEYVLLHERPLSRKAAEKVIADLVDELNEKNSADYARTFRELGLSASNSQALILHASKIARASLEAEAALQQLMQARNDFDRSIRSQLSPEGYARYRATEAQRPAQRELEKLDEYCMARNGKPVEESQQDLLFELVQEAQAYTDSIASYRPYDGIPGVKMGTEAVLSHLEAETARLAHGLARIQARVAEVGLNHDHQTLMAGYLADEIEARSRQIEAMRQKLAANQAAAAAIRHETAVP